jgi:hypothetical protein
MAYTILNNDGTVLLRLADGTVNNTLTSVAFVGRDVAGYGQYYNQNLVTLITNSANPNYKPPANPTVGQLWYDTTYARMRVWDNKKFKTVGGAVVNSQPPAGLTEGDFWYDTTYQVLNYFDGFTFDTVFSYPRGQTTGWYFVPQTNSVLDNNNVIQQVALLENYGQVLGAISNSDFTASNNDTNNLLRFASANTSSYHLVRGLNIIGDIAATGTFYGNLISPNIQATNLYATSARVQNLRTYAPAIMGDITSTGTVTATNIVITSSTNAVSTNTGALQVAGGVSIGRSLFVSGASTFTNIVIHTSTASSISTNTGALQVVGGVGIGGDLFVGGKIVAQELDVQYTTVTTTLVKTDDVFITYNTSPTNSAITGALQVSGGVGIGGGIFVSNAITATTSNITGNESIGGSLAVTGNIRGVIVTATTANITGNMTVGGTVTIAATSGTPSNFSASTTGTTYLKPPSTWLQVTVGASVYYLPLYS